MLSRIVNRHEGKFEKFFKFLPGLILWIALTSPIWMSLKFPTLFGNLVIFFAVFWIYRGLVLVVGLFIGHYKYSKAIKQNWLQKIFNLDFDNLHEPETLPKTSKLPKHLIVIPIGSAKYETLEKTLTALKNQNYPKELIYISLSFEQSLIDKDIDCFKNTKKKIIENFECFGDRLMFFKHPTNIAGEVPGAASNRSWGNMKAIEFLRGKGEMISDFITTSPDEDIRLHKEFLAACSYKYLTNKKRTQRFYQTAMYLFSNNYWQVPSLIRAWSMSLTLPVLATSATHRTKRETWSCYSINLQVMEDVNFWDTSICIDDTPFFWRPFNHFDGDFECEIFYIPLYADAVYHPNKMTNYKEQYDQLVRWGWGVMAFPIAMKIFFTNNKIPLWKKFYKLSIMFEIVVLIKVASIIFFLAVPLIGLINSGFDSQIQAHTFPQTLSFLMKIMALFLIPTMYFKYKLLPHNPLDWRKGKSVFMFLFEIPLQFVLLYTYSLVPFLIGPTLMMFGYEYNYKIVEKHR